VDPDVFVTIAFSGYAALVVLGIGAALWATSGRRHAAGSDEVRRGIVVASVPPTLGADEKREEKESNG
jgi:hypothetical protein